MSQAFLANYSASPGLQWSPITYHKSWRGDYISMFDINDLPVWDIWRGPTETQEFVPCLMPQPYVDPAAFGGQIYYGIRPTANCQNPPTGTWGPLYRIQGITKDSGGVAVGNATVKLYYTEGPKDIVRDTMVSDANGNYGFGTPDNTTKFYVVAYRAGPDIEGTTVNTLVGS